MSEKGFSDAPIMREGAVYDYVSNRELSRDEIEQYMKEEEMQRLKLDAYDDLKEYLDEDEVIEIIVFGKWGWDGYKEPDEKPVPETMQGIMLTLDQARPLMKGWKFEGGYGAPECYAANIWTNKRVIWVTQYDGSTSLNSAYRVPRNGLPGMPGG